MLAEYARNLSWDMLRRIAEDAVAKAKGAAMCAVAEAELDRRRISQAA